MVKDLIDRLNNYCFENNVYNIEDVVDEFDEELKNVNFKYICSVDYDEHRWYTLSKDVYSVYINGVNYYIGVWNVNTLKSESMTIEDCMNKIRFFEMEEYTTVSYREKC